MFNNIMNLTDVNLIMTIGPVYLFGYDKIINYANHFINPEFPIIEIGSGNGDVSKLLYDHGFNIIAIDPFDGIYTKNDDSVIYKPDYPTVKDLVDDKPELIGNCNLVMIWCNPLLDCYDLEAIKILKPYEIIVLTELENNTANSTIFHKWMKSDYDSPKYNGSLDYDEFYEEILPENQMELLNEMQNVKYSTVRKMLHITLHDTYAFLLMREGMHDVEYIDEYDRYA